MPPPPPDEIELVRNLGNACKWRSSEDRATRKRKNRRNSVQTIGKQHSWPTAAAADCKTKERTILRSHTTGAPPFPPFFCMFHWRPTPDQRRRADSRGPTRAGDSAQTLAPDWSKSVCSSRVTRAAAAAELN